MRDQPHDGDVDLSRSLWQRYETLHELTYFAPEARAASDALGLRGGWMGYFALRSAPLGDVPPSVVRATFFGFAAARVERALPDAWQFTTTERALQARLAGIDAALRRVLGDDLLAGENVRRAAQIAWAAAQSADVSGRPLAAANQVLPRPEAPHLALWQAATTLREHRGDGHNAVLVARGVSPIEAQLIKVAADESDGENLRSGRGHTVEAWDTATARLAHLGVLDAAGRLTASGRALREDLERDTDRASWQPWQVVGRSDALELVQLLDPLARAVITSGVLPYPNPTGLPALAS